MTDDLDVPDSGANAPGWPEMLCAALDSGDARRMALIVALCLDHADAERDASLDRLRSLDRLPAVVRA